MIRLDSQGLIPAITQDAITKEVLMLGYMNPDSLKRTMEEGEVWYYSRSRESLWHKGESSGNFLKVQSIWQDCDGDTLLLKVEPTGPACHTGEPTCFFEQPNINTPFQVVEQGPGILEELYCVIQDRQKELPDNSYTTRLISEGVERVAQKVIEEAGETALAAVVAKRDSLPGEVADLLYHVLVLIAIADVTTEQVWEELRMRRGGKG